MTCVVSHLVVAVAGAFALATCLSAGAKEPAVRLSACANCHGADGNAKQIEVPSLASQPKTFLENQMIMIREGLREIPSKRGQFDDLTDPEIIALAKHFSSQRISPSADKRDSQLFERGQAAARDCSAAPCHLSNYEGRDQMPRLAGQKENYLLETMRKFKTNQALGRDTIMAASLYGVSDEDLKAMAHYFSRLGEPRAPEKNR